MKSEKRKDIADREYVQHYDENGKPSIKSYVETNQYTGRKEVVHYDENGRRVGTSKKKRDYWTDKEYIETNYENPYEVENFIGSLIDKFSLLILGVIVVIFVVSYCYFSF